MIGGVAFLARLFVGHRGLEEYDVTIPSSDGFHPTPNAAPIELRLAFFDAASGVSAE